MKRNIFATALLLVLVMASCALAGPQDFKLVNKTGVDIYSVFISPSDSDDWGEDVKDVKVLKDGQSLTVTFDSQNKAALWDIMVADKDGTTLEWTEFDLFEISVVTLLKDGEASYE